MAERFDPHAYAKELADTGQYAHEDGVLYHWTGTHWRPVEDEDGERQAYAWLVKHDRNHVSPDNANKAYRAAMLWCCKLPQTTRNVVIPCLNGYLHVENGELALRPADAELGLRHVLGCSFQTDAPAPERFRNFIRTILPDEAVRCRVQEYIGYTLTADARHQRAQLWLGSGANGKGVLANIVQALHGKPEAIQLDKLEGFGLSVLVGASLIYCDEIPRGRFNEQLLKSMIAGERIQIDRKYLRPLSVRVRGKWLVLGNHLPTVTDHSAGFWRRWDVVPFGVTIREAERDPVLTERIVDTELAGVLVWALEGLIRLERRGAFEVALPQAMAHLLHDAKSETNSVQAWCEECGIVVSPERQTAKDEVFGHYRLWCERNGLAPMASPRFWTRFRELAPIEESRRRAGSGQIRICNVALPDAGSCGSSSIVGRATP